MADRELCELCGKNAEMDFNCLMPSFEKICKGNICLECFGNAAVDMEIAVALVKKRVEAKGISLPTTMEVLATLMEKP